MANKFNNSKTDSIEKRINDEIQGYSIVRIVGTDIESKEVSLNEAKKIAKNMNKDLIEINSNLKVPILKIENYDKYMYEQKKALKKSKQNVKSNILKEIKISVNITSHDLQIKATKAKEFFNEDFKVKVTLMMKGRELARREENKRSIFEFISMLEDVAVPESMPKDNGNQTVVILKKKKK